MHVTKNFVFISFKFMMTVNLRYLFFPLKGDSLRNDKILYRNFSKLGYVRQRYTVVRDILSTNKISFKKKREFIISPCERNKRE